MARQRRSVMVALGVLVALGGPGCLFDTRPSESGGDGDEVVWVSPETLGNALGNLERALESEGKVLTNYGRSFSEEQLEMILDPSDEAELGENEFAEWSARQEEQRMSGILNSSEASVSVAWTIRDSLDEAEGVRYFEDLGYELIFRMDGQEVIYAGKVDLYFEDDGTGQWYIIKWEDERDGANRTWGWLRARNQIEFQ